MLVFLLKFVEKNLLITLLYLYRFSEQEAMEWQRLLTNDTVVKNLYTLHLTIISERLEKAKAAPNDVGVMTCSISLFSCCPNMYGVFSKIIIYVLLD